MTLRLRLVLALVALVAVGLAVFGVATYTAYSRSQHQRLDEQLRTSVGFMTGKLYEQVFTTGSPSLDPGAPGMPPVGDGRRAPPLVVPSGTYGELRDAAGAAIASIQLSDSASQPDLPDDLAPPAQGSLLLTTGSIDGGGRWRVVVSASDHRDGNAVIVAGPMDELNASLHRLVLIEDCRRAGPPGRTGPRRVADPQARAAPAGAHGHLGPVDHRRRSLPAGLPGRDPHRGGPARVGPQHDAG